MDKQQSINLVKNTFESAFEKIRFKLFIKNLLNQYEESEIFRTGAYIPDTFKKYVTKYERLGKYIDSDNKRIDILIVHLKKDTSIENARSMQRNFIAGYLQGKYGTEAIKDAALVAFVSPNSDDWRFSLVKLDVQLKQTAKGGMKTVDLLTPAKRWSFLVGVQEKSHTAQRQFVPIIEDDEHNPTLDQLEEAFNIEKVTKEFFDKYRGLFIWTKEELDKAIENNPKTKSDFESKNIDTVNLAKKLLGQITFLYYLQKKGWFGVPRDANWGDGSRNFLRELFEKKHGNYQNFFNDILEPLFYEALRIDRSHDDHYYSRFNCKIPFLNGGLFDPLNNYDWVKNDILLSNELFSNNNQTKEGDTGDGILDIFDRYNFTVKEDEPLEKEVAIDPELLGKAYEKFNAIRPDNYAAYLDALKSGKKGDETKFNKQFGVYYTPREIVQYMCQQSLINYLYTELNSGVVYQSLGDNQLDMFSNQMSNSQLGMKLEHQNAELISKDDIALFIQHGESLRELEENLEAKVKETKSNHGRLSESIRKNASLIDERLASIKVCDPAVGSGAFPVGMMNEIVKARIILDIFISTAKIKYELKREFIENSLYGVDIDPGAVEIAKLRLWLSLVVDEEDPSNIKPLPNLDYKIVCGNSLVGFPEKWGSPIEKEIEFLICQHVNETNPKVKEKLKRLIDEKLEFRYGISMKALGYQVNFDFRTVFSEVFRTKDGFDIIFANPPYIQLSKAKNTPDWYKKYLKNRYGTSGGRLNTFIFFIHLSFDILKPRGHLAIIVPNTILTQEYYSNTRELLLKHNCLREIVQYSELPFEEAIVENVTLVASKEKLHKYVIEIFLDDLKKINLIDQKLNTQFLRNPNFLINFYVDNIIDKIFSHDFKPLKEYCEINQGIALKGDRSLSLRTSNPSGNFYKKLDGRNIGKYLIEWDGIYLDWDLKRIHSGKRKEIYLTEEKLFFRRVSEDLIFAYDDEQHFALNTLVVVNIKNNSEVCLKCLLALLNSKLMNRIYRKKFKSTKTVFSEIQTRTVGQLPIPFISRELEKRIVILVDKILDLKRDNPQANTSIIEEEINKLVYHLYDLSEEDIETVEGLS